MDEEDEMPVGANGARPGAVAKKRTIRVGEVVPAAAPRNRHGSRQKVPASKYSSLEKGFNESFDR